ncbi:MAG: acyl-CoA dehydrogenase family protein [Planctomycetaceae bacterium]|nr:acyl-CoA dehydrogenase family protein [Planctomycetaceae bacterium]
MDFSISSETRDLLATVREFVQRELIPLEDAARGRSFSDLLPLLAEKRRMVRSMGLWTPQIPKAFGGVGLGFLEHAMVSEELARCPYGHFAFNCQAPDAGNMEVLIEFGTPSQQERWLKPLLQGEIRSCFSMTEVDRPGSNPVWMDTTAVRVGDEYVINGRKWFTTAADGAAFAIVMAVTNPDAPPHERASMIIVPTDTPGFERVRNISCMGHAGDGWDSHAEIRYTDCHVPAENLLGKEGAGFAIAQARLGPGRIHHCMRWIGISERSFDLMCQRAATREIAPGIPLGTKQTIQNWIADSRATINAARLMVLHAGWKIDQVGARDARIEISAIKFYVAEVMMQVIDRALQTHGALGISDDTVLSWFYRNERAARIYDGPDEVHRTVLARQELKRYGISI